MRNQRFIDLSVGLFFLVSIAAAVVLVLKVSGLNGLSNNAGYHVTADFANVGGLRVRAPVSIAGVRIGEVQSIVLKPGSFSAKVTLLIQGEQNKIPYFDTSARILTEGLLGSNYISITPGFEKEDDEGAARYLTEGSEIQKTEEAVILENLIGQLVFNMNK